MNDDIKLPPMPKPHTPPVFATAANTPSVKAGYELGGYEKTPPLFDEHQLEAFAREAVRLNAQATSMQWPKPEDVTPEMLSAFRSAYKEGDFWRARIHGALCAMLSAAPAAPQPAQPLTDEQINEGRQALPYDIEDKPEPWAFKEGVRFAEQAHEIGVKND